MQQIHTASQIRAVYLDWQASERDLQTQFFGGKLPKERYESLRVAAQNRAVTAFTKELRSDALNVHNELKRRLSPEARKHVVLAAPDLNVTIFALIPSDFSIGFIDSLAGEIEQMAILLPQAENR